MPIQKNPLIPRIQIQTFSFRYASNERWQQALRFDKLSVLGFIGLGD